MRSWSSLFQFCPLCFHNFSVLVNSHITIRWLLHRNSNGCFHGGTRLYSCITFTGLCSTKHAQSLPSPGHICRILSGSGERHVQDLLNTELQAWQVKFCHFWCNPKLLLKSSSEQDWLIHFSRKSRRSDFGAATCVASLTGMQELSAQTRPWLLLWSSPCALGVQTPTF